MIDLETRMVEPAGPSMTEEDFIDDVVRVCRDIPNTLAVAMGGARARGDQRVDSDFALYYRGRLDPFMRHLLGMSSEAREERK